MTAQIKLDEIVKTPDIKGKFGRAWRADIAEAQRAANVRPEDDGSVVMWIVEAPWAHLIWHSYAVILVHLRPMPDVRPIKFYLAAATHEIWLYALDPNQPRQPMIEFGQPKWLTPMNFGTSRREPAAIAAR
jgi:hypothetical protein